MGNSRPTKQKAEARDDIARQLYNSRRRAAYATPAAARERARRQIAKDQTVGEDQTADEKQIADEKQKQIDDKKEIARAEAEAQLEKRELLNAAELQLKKESNVEHQLQMTLAEFGQGFENILKYIHKPRKNCHNPKKLNLTPRMEYMLTLKMAPSLVLGHITDEQGVVLPIEAAIINIGSICKGNFCGEETWNWAAGIFMIGMSVDGSDWQGYQWLWSTSETGITGKMSIWDVNTRCPHKLESCLKNINLEIFFCSETMTSNVTYHLEWKCAGQYVIPMMDQIRDQDQGRSYSAPTLSQFEFSENYDFDPADQFSEARNRQINAQFEADLLTPFSPAPPGQRSFSAEDTLYSLDSLIDPALKLDHVDKLSLTSAGDRLPLCSKEPKRQVCAGQKSSSVEDTLYSLDSLINPAMELDHVDNPSLAPAGGSHPPLFSEAQNRMFNAQFEANLLAPFPPPPPAQTSSSALDNFHFSAGFNPVIGTGKDAKPVIGSAVSNSPLSVTESSPSSAPFESGSDIDGDATPADYDCATDAAPTAFGSYRDTPAPTMSGALVTATASSGQALSALRAHAALYPGIPRSEEYIKVLHFINGRGRVSKTRDPNPRCLRCRSRHWATCSRGKPCDECRRAGAKCVYGVGDGHDREY